MMRVRLIVLALAGLMAPGCDSNPDAPTAPEGVIISSSETGEKGDGEGAAARAKAKAKRESAQ